MHGFIQAWRPGGRRKTHTAHSRDFDCEMKSGVVPEDSRVAIAKDHVSFPDPQAFAAGVPERCRGCVNGGGGYGLLTHVSFMTLTCLAHALALPSSVTKNNRAPLSLLMLPVCEPFNLA